MESLAMLINDMRQSLGVEIQIEESDNSSEARFSLGESNFEIFSHENNVEMQVHSPKGILTKSFSRVGIDDDALCCIRKSNDKDLNDDGLADWVKIRVAPDANVSEYLIILGAAALKGNPKPISETKRFVSWLLNRVSFKWLRPPHNLPHNPFE